MPKTRQSVLGEPIITHKNCLRIYKEFVAYDQASKVHCSIEGNRLFWCMHCCDLYHGMLAETSARAGRTCR